MSYRHVVIAMTLGVIATACVAPRPVPLSAVDSAPPPAILVTLTNTAFYDATVYACHGAQRIRIGFVPGFSTVVIPVPPRLFDDQRAQLYVKLVGATGEYLSDEVTIAAGGRVELRIMHALEESSLTPLPNNRR
jgi:hypothetical protein